MWTLFSQVLLLTFVSSSSAIPFTSIPLTLSDLPLSRYDLNRLFSIMVALELIYFICNVIKYQFNLTLL